MALVNKDPNGTGPDKRDPAREGHELSTSHSRQGSTGQPEPSVRQSEGEHTYGRQGGSIADTGTRTDVPVGENQVESSSAGRDGERARERQGHPPPSGAPADRGK